MTTFKQQFYRLRSFLLGIDPGIADWYYRYRYQPKPGSLLARIDELTAGIKPFYFLQVGGNDGFINDPIFRFVKRHGWKGIIVEPQPRVFEQELKRTYRWERRVILENVAIADQPGERTLYKIAFSEARWATGLATFHRPTLLYQIESGYVAKRAAKEGVSLPQHLEDYLSQESVRCTTIQALIDQHGFPQLDLLQIDTEGYDFEIIKTLDFSRLKPRIISFEMEHLDAKDWAACQALLQSQGYTVEVIVRDAIAYLT